MKWYLENKMDEIFDWQWNLYAYHQLQYQELPAEECGKESIRTLVRWYADKKSGKTRYAFKKLSKAILTLPSKEQESITLLFLQGCKGDADFVCLNIQGCNKRKGASAIVWRESYIEPVKAVWEKYHSPLAASVIIQYLPQEYLIEQMEQLSKVEKVYFELCRRLAKEELFKIDFAKIRRVVDINSYLFLLHESQQEISDQEAKSLLFQWIGSVAHLSKNLSAKQIAGIAFANGSILQLQGLDTAIYLLLLLGREEVVDQFTDWCREVEERLKDIINENYFSRRYTPQTLQEKLAEYVLAYLPEEIASAGEQGKWRNYIIRIGHPFVEPHKQETPYEQSEEQRGFSNPYLNILMEELDME